MTFDDLVFTWNPSTNSDEVTYSFLNGYGVFIAKEGFTVSDEDTYEVNILFNNQPFGDSFAYQTPEALDMLLSKIEKW